MLGKPGSSNSLQLRIIQQRGLKSFLLLDITQLLKESSSNQLSEIKNAVYVIYSQRDGMIYSYSKSVQNE